MCTQHCRKSKILWNFRNSTYKYLTNFENAFKKHTAYTPFMYELALLKKITKMKIIFQALSENTKGV